MTQNKLISAQVGRDLAARFERLAHERERSVSAELRRAIRGHLERESAEQHAHTENGAA